MSFDLFLLGRTILENVQLSTLAPYGETLEKPQRTTHYLPACFENVGVAVVPVGLFLAKRTPSHPVSVCKSLVMASIIGPRRRPNKRHAPKSRHATVATRLHGD